MPKYAPDNHDGLHTGAEIKTYHIRDERDSLPKKSFTKWFCRNLRRTWWLLPIAVLLFLTTFNHSHITTIAPASISLPVTKINPAPTPAPTPAQTPAQTPAPTPAPTKPSKPAAPVKAPGAYEFSEKDPLFMGNFWMDPKLCAAIEKVVGESSLVDFGAGLGQYGRCLTRNFQNLLLPDHKDYATFKKYLMERMKMGNLLDKPPVIKSYEGYDGAPKIEYITKGWVKSIDLSARFDLGRRFDWVMSLEVGEHIPAQFEDIFIGNLVRHATQGIILSWAVLGQGGHNHVNNQANEHVIEKMKALGWKHDIKSQKILRKDLIQKYFENTVMVFRKSEKNR